MLMIKFSKYWYYTQPNARMWLCCRCSAFMFAVVVDEVVTNMMTIDQHVIMIVIMRMASVQLMLM